jgi:hypothetical protein
MKRLMFAGIMVLFATIAWATPPSATIVYQPMTSEGLAATRPFEAWVYFDKSPDPASPGYAFPAGSTFRFKFPQAFTPQPGSSPQAVLLNGWPQGPIQVPFTVGLDPQDARTIAIKLTAPLSSGPPDHPGLKAIHLRWGPLNPSQPGDYPIQIEYSDAGELSGSTQAIASITPKPVPNIAAYNTLHEGRNENWQHVRAGQAATIPIDLLVTLPDQCRSFVALRPTGDGNLEIMSDGRPIGTITKRGVPLALKPEPFGPGFARLGIIRFYVTAGTTPGNAQIEGRLTGGTSYTIQVIVER